MIVIERLAQPKGKHKWKLRVQGKEVLLSLTDLLRPTNFKAKFLQVHRTLDEVPEDKEEYDHFLNLALQRGSKQEAVD